MIIIQFFITFADQTKKANAMGKGDIKSKRGKIVNGSYGVRRRRKKAVKEVVKVEVKAAVKKKEKVKK